MKKILIVRFSSIGDIVLTTPVIRSVKNQIEGAEVHYLTKQVYAGIVETNPHIDHVLTIEKDIDEIIDQLKQENYDFIVDLHNNLRTKRLKLGLKKPARSFPKLNIKKFLLTQFKINTMPKQHIVDRYFEATTPLGVKNDNKGLDYFIPKADEIKLIDYNVPEEYIAYAIGAQFNTKKLPENKIIELIKKTEKPIVLLGGKEDQATGKNIADRCENATSLCGQLNLNQSASVIRQAQKVITHDTGLMHIAAAFNKSIISIWGNTVPDLGMYPYLPNEDSIFSMHEVDGLNCRPCSKIGHQECPKQHFKCMINQDLDQIAQEI